MYVVLGASGRAGGEVAHALIERGEAVRVVVRRREQGEKWRIRGAEVAVANIEDAEEMIDALRGASGAFLLNPPPVSGDPYAQTEKFGAALADAARKARLPKAVILSSIGAQHASGTGIIATLHRFETLLDGAASSIAFMRSGYFVETWREVAQTVMSDSVLPTFIDPSRKIPMASTIDVGRTAADLLGEEWSGKRVVELAGPEEWSAGDVASAFSGVLGRPVTPVLVPPEDRAALLAEEGVLGEVADALLGMYEGIANGLFARQKDTEHRRGIVSLKTAIERLIAKS
ncbi:NmrA family NAD(P)-binding protein [Rhizobium sp. LCM 4573]|uniref:NmrA family NAD(P)-binding protein n=1 Tax=Rhizobium sp. LCM 4573 TaxID=1848291 RepID=UPI0008D9BF22|nr:NmrA family NAD(P)-binding protein [Rhizobium sp. LCM 4573]OHV81094.1 NmrA family protein [Rhizobium sp. LCM 4573]